ncbi:MAG: O-methyltransferase [Phycisphaerales bacterium]|nr:O-methyltransferase [Phycisphaerales bacterium]
MEMTPHRWEATSAYLSEVFGRPDRQLSTHRERARAAGLPDIAVSPDVGRLLHLLTSLANNGRGAGVAVEVGTLGGFSGIWIARGLAPGGRLYTIEPEKKHAAFARDEFKSAGVADRVTQIDAAAPGAISELGARLAPASVDLLFLDAIKADYRAYVEAAETLLKPGALIIADNALGSGDWWIDTPSGTNAARDAVDAFNRWMATGGRFDCACVPIREGVLIARKRA